MRANGPLFDGAVAAQLHGRNNDRDTTYAPAIGFAPRRSERLTHGRDPCARLTLDRAFAARSQLDSRFRLVDQRMRRRSDSSKAGEQGEKGQNAA